jgi:hypothetical protein
LVAGRKSRSGVAASAAGSPIGHRHDRRFSDLVSLPGAIIMSSIFYIEGWYLGGPGIIPAD